MAHRIVYLDWSNVVHLTHARLARSADYADALSRWRASGATLAISLVHVVEARHHGDADVRAERVRTLQDFLPICTDVQPREMHPTRLLSMVEREILHAVAHKNVLNLPGHPIQDPLLPDTAALPIRWQAPERVNTIRSYDAPQFGQFTSAVYRSVEAMVDNLARPAGTPYERLRLSDLPDQHAVSSQALASSDKSAALLGVITDLDAAIAKMPPGALRDQLTTEVDALRNMHTRIAAAGLRQVWADLHGVAGDLSRDRRFLDDIAAERSFQQTAAFALSDVLHVEPAYAVELAKRIPLTSCPGAWLSRQVDLEIRKGEASTDASSAYDLDHLVYFPYVDMFFSDVRIAGHTERALRRSGDVPELAGRAPALSVGRSVSALAKSFDSPST